MRFAFAISLAGLAACASSPSVAAIRPLAPPESPMDRAVAGAAAGHPDVIRAGQIGQSREGRALHLLTVARPGEVTPDSRPAILIVAGLDGRQTTGPEVAIALATRLAETIVSPAPPPNQPSEPAPEGEPEQATQPARPGPLAATEVFDRYTVYIVPQLNPDTAAWLAEAGRPKSDFGWIMVPDDSDHDGRVDEDGPQDLNGDGVISMMRVKNPRPGWGLEADRMINPDEPRLTRSPDRMKGERAEYALVVEGRDVDGDGRIAEDPPGGVDLDRNFPYRWPEYEAGAGRSALSAPESRALVDWMLRHPNIVAVLTFGPADNLVNVPHGGQMDWTGQVPTGLENDDRPYHEKVAEVFKEITKMNEAPSGDAAGSFRGWAYAHFGVFSFSTPVWVRPDQMKKEEKSDESKGEASDKKEEPQPESEPEMDASVIQARITEFMTATPQRQAEMRAEFDRLPPETRSRIMGMFSGQQQPEAGPRRGGRRGPGGPGPGGPPGGGGGGAPGAKPADDSDDAKWLKYSDEARESAGFVAWQPFDHPDLGPVEIGGFVPGFRLNAPSEEVPRLVDEQARFVGKILERLPRLVVEPPSVEALGDGVWRVGVRLVNDGFLPTRSAIGVKSRRLPPIIARIEVPDQGVVSGERLRRVGALPGSGGNERVEWVVTAQPGSAVKVRITSPEFGEQAVTTTLEEASR